MPIRPDDYRAALDEAHRVALEWLERVEKRPIPPQPPQVLRSATSWGLDDNGEDPAVVVRQLADAVEPGLMAAQSGRFFGWVVGGTLPAAMGADWMVSAWDQDTVLAMATPGVVAIEEAASRWLLDALGLPASAAVGFVTGGMMANFTCLASARSELLAGLGWDLGRDGLTGAPRIHVIAGEERHETIDVSLRLLGLPAVESIPADEQGRIEVPALAEALRNVPPGDPVIVSLAAGNLHSGAFEDFGRAIEAAHAAGAWVHIDGAFGLWAAASHRRAHLTSGFDAADSWATDAHKTLNVPYDCGVAIVRRGDAIASAMGERAAYLEIDDERLEPYEKNPEWSRRARGVPVWAALRSLGRVGLAELVDGLADHAAQLAEGVRTIPGATVLNEVVFTQVSLAFEDDARTRAVTEALLASGTTWMSGSTWHGREVIRVSVSNWATDDEDVRRSLDALRTAAASVA